MFYRTGFSLFRLMSEKRDKLFFKNYILTPTIILGLVFNLSFVKMPDSFGQGNTVFLRQVRVLDVDPAGLHNPAGLAFSNRANAFEVLQARASGQATTDVIKLTPFAHQAGSARIVAAVQNPINVALDNQAHRLLLFVAASKQLLAVAEDASGNLDPTTLTHYDASRFGVQDPQGLSVDADSGTLFILDAVGPQVVRITPT